MSDEEAYWTACWWTATITSVLTFAGTWIAFCNAYPGFLPVVLGWLPAGIIAFIVWWIVLYLAPLIWLGILGIIYLIAKAS